MTGIEERIAPGAPQAPVLARWYAKPTVKVNIDNIIASTITAAAAGLAVDHLDAQSSLGAIGEGFGVNALAFPLVYSAVALVSNRYLAGTGVPQQPLIREIAEGNATTAVISIGYHAVLLPMQSVMIHHGIEPGWTIFWSNVALTTAISPFRGWLYRLCDRLVDKGKEYAGRWRTSAPEAVE